MMMTTINPADRQVDPTILVVVAATAPTPGVFPCTMDKIP
jgi:hypothetical protein